VAWMSGDNIAIVRGICAGWASGEAAPALADLGLELPERGTTAR
jgi:hypothetical protein